MEREPNIITLAVVLVAGWFCVGYGAVHIRDREPKPPTDFDYTSYKVAKEVLAGQTNVVDALATPEERYQSELVRYCHKRIMYWLLLVSGNIVTFYSGFRVSEACGKNGWLGGILAILFGPLILAWTLQRSRKK